jgi:outer membrane cobalamin receptor
MTRVALCVALLLSAITSADAQSPLERRVSIHVRDVSLREALDRVAVLGAIRLSYSGDNLPLDRRVTVDRDTARIAEILEDLLRSYPVAPVAVANDHVVLSPRETQATDSTTRGIAVLDRVVITGSVIDSPERALPIALDVIRGRDIERRQERELSEVLSGSVPGVWLWEQTPTSLMARYGSIRGASSFGLSYPKIYVDGIEVANPLLLTHITPELVERVEVIRGPQGGALYGSDAISGVVNIVSRHEGVDPEGNRALLRSAAGYSDSRYTTTGVAVQDHALTMRAGSNLRSVGVTIGGSTSGEYIPQAYSREVRVVGQTRLIGAHSKLTANARFHGKNAGVPDSPLLAAFRPDSLESDLDPQRLRLYAAGSTLTLAPAGRWTYTMTAGVDGYTLDNVANDHTPVPSIADTELRSASGSAARGTLRANALTIIGKPDDVAATLTVGVERSDLWDRTLRERLDGSASGSTERFENSRSNSSGILAHGVLALRDATFFTGGVRGERIVQPNGLTQYAILPLAGVALLQEFQGGTIKWRASYGRGIRASHSPNRVTHEAKLQLDNPSLAPEEQSGVELGADLRVGRFFGLQITGFDQLVSGLVQQVPVRRPDGSRGPGSAEDLWFQLQNVGEISNRGWESHASFVLGPVGLDGTATFVDSRVRQTLFDYSGDLRPGDRMLAVPARTFSGTASYAGRRGFYVSTTISRASNWINYDRLAIARALIERSVDFYDIPGNKLREFWARYPGATRLRSSFSVDAWRGMVVSVTGENLLGYQRGEPDTITIVPGRTVTVGVKAKF